MAYTIIGEKVNKVSFKSKLKKFAIKNKMSGFVEDLDNNKLSVVVAGTESANAVFKEYLYKQRNDQEIVEIIEEEYKKLWLAFLFNLYKQSA
ncbi:MULTISPECIES: acylphosphatase [Bacillaceae]|uniref:Acylphosphatase n=1 Tax=Evansella alkalicola TaxID=745819 RepID=A0ABS6JVY2_9BACI|nr:MULTISPECIES: acylphosphatase [Bacillaceae]MBU9722719.1 acylphosphatase [Bacillus alkalicola]